MLSNELTMIHVTPIAQGLQGMREYKIAFTHNSRAAAFVSPEQPAQNFDSLATLSSEQIHIGSQVGRVYRLVLREGSQVFALLVVLLEYVTQPKKRSKQGSLESKEELAARQSSPKSWTVAYIPTPETFAPLPTYTNPMGTAAQPAASRDANAYMVFHSRFSGNAELEGCGLPMLPLIWFRIPVTASHRVSHLA